MAEETISAQELFDHVVKAVVAQGRQSLNAAKNKCQYRGEGGMKCAAGHALRDDEYNPSIEGKAVDRIDLPERLTPHIDILWALQQAHDDACDDSREAFIADFTKSARKVGTLRGLTMPELS